MDHPYTDMTGVLDESSDWEAGEGAKPRSWKTEQSAESEEPMIIHMIDSPLKCDYPGCKSSGKTFKRIYELGRHKLIHFPSKKLTCPIFECKHKKKGKFYTRNDKFREHIASHGESALFCCPIPGCRSVRVKSAGFALHVASDHEIKERLKVTDFLTALLIEPRKGLRSCPIPRCRYGTNEDAELTRHLYTHDLVERVHHRSSIGFHVGYLPSWGKAICPVCKIQVCSETGHLGHLWSHLEDCHPAGDLNNHGDIIAELEQYLSSVKYWYPKLRRVVREFIEAKSVLSTKSVAAFTTPASSNSGIFTPSTSIGVTNNIQLIKVESNNKKDVSASTSSGASRTQIPWSPPLEPHVLSHASDPVENVMAGQGQLIGQTLAESQDLVPPQLLFQPQSFIQIQDTLPPQASIQPHLPTAYQSFMDSSFVQYPTLVPTSGEPSITPDICQWQPMQHWGGTLAQSQSHICQQPRQPEWPQVPQWPLQPEIVGFGNESLEQNAGWVGPFAGDTSYGVDTWPSFSFDNSVPDGENQEWQGPDGSGMWSA